MLIKIHQTLNNEPDKRLFKVEKLVGDVPCIKSMLTIHTNDEGVTADLKSDSLRQLWKINISSGDFSRLKNSKGL